MRHTQAGFGLSTFVGLVAYFGLGQVQFQVAADDSVYFSIPNADASLYYDLTTDDQCYAHFDGPGWSDRTGMTGPNAVAPACENQHKRTLTDIGLGTPIAFNNLLVDNNLLDWCGRIVKVYKADGSEYKLDTGPFFIWDGCKKCSEVDRIDLSSEAILGLQDQEKDGETGCDNPRGLKVEVTNDYFWRLAPGAEVDEAPDPALFPTGSFAGPIPVAVTSSGLPKEYMEPVPGVAPGPTKITVTAGPTVAAGAGAPGNGAGVPTQPAVTTQSSATSGSGYSSQAPSQPSVPGGSSLSAPHASGSVSVSGGYQSQPTQPTQSVQSAPSAPFGPSGSSAPAVPSGSVSGFGGSGVPSVPVPGASGSGVLSPPISIPSASDSASSTSALLAINNPSASASVSESGTGTLSGVTSAETGGPTFTPLAQKADCTSGDHRCQGGNTEVCNFITPGSPDQGWMFMVEGCEMFETLEDCQGDA